MATTQLFILQFDGGSRGNTANSVAGAGAVLFKCDGRQRCRPENFVSEATVFLHGTNNEAEYTALLAGLHLARQHGVRDLLAEGDSELVVKQVKGVYRVRKPHLVPLFEQARGLAAGFSSFDIRHIPREQNLYADRLANRAMDRRRSEGLLEALPTATGKQPFYSPPQQSAPYPPPPPSYGTAPPPGQYFPPPPPYGYPPPYPYPPPPAPYHQQALSVVAIEENGYGGSYGRGGYRNGDGYGGRGV